MLSRKLSLIFGNIRGIFPASDKSKISQLDYLSRENNSIVIALTESHLNSDILDSEVNMDGWAVVRSDRVARSHGGVINYVRDDIPYSDELIFSNTVCEVLGIYLFQENIAVVTVYRPPGCKTNAFKEAIDRVDGWLRSWKK